MMKYIYLTAFFISLSLNLSFALTQSVQESNGCDSINNELTSKFRFLGDWDAKGTPSYLDPASDAVSQALIDFVNETLPESTNFAASNDDYFGLDVQLNTELQENSEVYLTLVHEGAGWKNTLGFYTYDINNPPATVYDIDSLVVLFPNVSQMDVIKPGDKVLLGEFPANTGIGYFLIAQGWVGDTICLTSHMVFTDARFNTFTTEQYRQQTILLSNEQENKFLLGFEDIKRPGGDNDFNDAVFYITAKPGAIDTTNIAKVPTATLSGDTTLCDVTSPAKIKVKLTGQAPWTIVYNNGIEDVEISGIQENILFFETQVKDTVSLVSVKDKNKFGIVDGLALVSISNPQVFLLEENVLCGEGNSGFTIDFEGIAPYSLTYTIDGQEKSIDNIPENHYDIVAIPGQTIKLISMQDAYCQGEVNEGLEATVRNVESPSLTVDGNGSICGNDNSTVLDLHLGGEGPWNLNYQIGEELYDIEITENEYQLELLETGNLIINSVQDANCVVELLANYPIENHASPTAEIETYLNDCGTEAASIDIALTGQGPWIVNYSLDGEIFSVISDQEILNLSLIQEGLFELVSVEDAYCDNIAEGSLQLEILETPTASIGEDVAICQDEEATIQIELTGVAPFTIVYSDGENSITVTTDENQYEFVTSEFNTYTLVSVDDAHCGGEVSGSATVSDGSEDIQVEIDAEENSCFGENIQLVLLGDTDLLTITWTTEGKGTFENTDQIETSYFPAENETGIIVFYAEVNNGCAAKTVSKEVTIIEEIDASFDFSPDQNLLTKSQITFTPSENSYDSYDWNFGDGNSSSATIASTEYEKGGKYTVELTASIAGCDGSGSAELEVLSKDELYVPNAFNPSAQNRENQVVKVYGNNVEESDFSFKIVNRWGKVMYQSNSFNEANTVGWNGVNNNNDVALEMNVFTYILKGRFIEGESFERTGTVTQLK